MMLVYGVAWHDKTAITAAPNKACIWCYMKIAI